MKTEKLMKWGFVIPTKEYNGGVLGGFGLGIFTMTAILSPEHRVANPLIWFGGLSCVVAGSLLARAAQRKRLQKEVKDENQAT